MKLEGSLDAFSLPDIFQLLSYTKKTGGLGLHHADAHGVVYFVDGVVSGAVAECGRQALARRVVGGSTLDPEAVQAAVAQAVGSGAAERGGGVVSALLAAGVVDTGTVVPLADAALHDAVFELLCWSNGEFAFTGDETNPDDVGLRLAPDEVVTRASEQRGRWAAATAIVPSPEAIPVLAGSAEAETVVRPGDWAVLRLVDGRRTVVEIVDLLGGGQLATVSTLADLVERGLIQVRAADTADPVTAVQATLALLQAAESAGPPSPPNPVATEPQFLAEPPATEAIADENLDENQDARAHADAFEEVDAPDEPLVVPAPTEITAAVVEALTPQAVPEPTPETSAEPVAPVPAAAGSTVVTVAEVDADARSAGPTSSQPRLGGAYTPGEVVPPRDEPFLSTRQPDFAESVGPALRSAPSLRSGAGGSVVGSSAFAMASGDPLIERDPSVNRSLLLRLIAGVRGL